MKVAAKTHEGTCGGIDIAAYNRRCREALKGVSVRLAALDRRCASLLKKT